MVSLAPYNTFGVDVKAKELKEINKIEDIPQEPSIILGLGANVLFTKDVEGLVLINKLKGIKEIGDGIFEVASGENWIDFVNFTVDKDLSGIEKLAYIPGTVGGALVGNIGAYGQIFEEVFVEAKANHEIYNKNDCKFGYRESIFKQNKVFIETVTIKLSKNTNAKRIAQETTALRKEKLPDWTKIGTAGSFFKNPFVSKEKLEDLLIKLPDLPNFPNLPNNLIKIPAGYLLETLGWRGKRFGNVGTFERHALVVVNYGGATGQEILDFTKQMQADVKKNFDVSLEPEVNII